MATDMLDIGNIQPGYSSTMSPPAWVSGPAILATITSSGPVASLMELSMEEAQLIEEEESSIACIAEISVTSLAAESHIAPLSPIQVLTWQRLKEAAADSPIYSQLISLIPSGLPTTISEWPEPLRPYYPYRHSLLVVDDLVLCGDRPLIPASLREEVLEHLHAAHSGSNTMLSRATQSLFWPGMKEDITTTRAHCTPCTKSAPSSPATPAQPPTQPDFPFSHCCMDFFSVEGRTYLALVDRYTGWLSVLKLKKDDSASVIAALRE